MYRWILLAIALFILYKLVGNELHRRMQSEKQENVKEREEKIARGLMVKDPTCGVYVDSDSNISVRDGDVLHRFCSYECRDVFLEKLRAAGREIPEIPREKE